MPSRVRATSSRSAGGVYPAQVLRRRPDEARRRDVPHAVGQTVTVAGLSLGRSDASGAPSFVTLDGIDVDGTFRAYLGSSNVMLGTCISRTSTSAKGALIFAAATT